MELHLRSFGLMFHYFCSNSWNRPLTCPFLLKTQKWIIWFSSILGDTRICNWSCLWVAHRSSNSGKQLKVEVSGTIAERCVRSWLWWTTRNAIKRKAHLVFPYGIYSLWYINWNGGWVTQTAFTWSEWCWFFTPIVCPYVWKYSCFFPDHLYKTKSGRIYYCNIYIQSADVSRWLS